MIHQLGITEAELNDPMWEDQNKALPDGSAILMREMARALKGEDYCYYPDSQAVDVPGCPPVIWAYYLDLFIRCEEFGLPSGRGWRNEPPWLLDYLQYMRRKKSEVESWRLRQQTRENKESLSPGDFGGLD